MIDRHLMNQGPLLTLIPNRCNPGDDKKLAPENHLYHAGLYSAQLTNRLRRYRVSIFAGSQI